MSISYFNSTLSKAQGSAECSWRNVLPSNCLKVNAKRKSYFIIAIRIIMSWYPKFFTPTYNLGFEKFNYYVFRNISIIWNEMLSPKLSFTCNRSFTCNQWSVFLLFPNYLCYKPHGDRDLFIECKTVEIGSWVLK